MLRASGILLLVFFCCIKGFSQNLLTLPTKTKADSSGIQPVRKLNKSEKGSEPDEVLVSGQKALLAAQEVDFKPGIAEALANLGQFYLEQGDSENALKYFRSYRHLCEEMQDSTLLIDSYSLLGKLYRRQQFPALAEERFRHALEIAHLINNKALLSKCYTQLGGLYYSEKNYALAETYLFKGLRYISTEDKVQYAVALNNIGMVYKGRKDYRKSLDYLKKALSILQDHPNVRDLSSIMMNIGEIYQVFNDYELAETYFTKALAAAQQSKAVERMVESYQNLASLYAEKEQYQLAYKYQSLYTAYKDTLTLLDHRANQAEVNKKMELERRERVMNQLIKEKEFELLNREYKISKLEISRKNQVIYIIGSLSLLLSMLAFILYQRNVLKRRKNQQLVLQNRHTAAHNKELQKLNSRLQQSEQQLKELIDTKDKFFSIISHDLRGPLQTLSGFILIMKRDIGLFTQEELGRFSLRMERSLQGVAALLDNLFQWASTQTGLIEFSPTEFKFLKLVKENVFLLHDTAELKEIRLKYDIAPDLSIHADIQMMRLLLRNLISNAIKFTPKGGEVMVTAYHEKAWTVIQVKDNGIGMTEEERLKLLNEKIGYTRRGTENEKGSGLGLLLCKEFVEMHKGRIEVCSAPGEGTTFTIYLPVSESKAKVEEDLQV